MATIVCGASVIPRVQLPARCLLKRFRRRGRWTVGVAPPKRRKWLMLPGVTTQHLSRLCIQHWPPRGHRRIIGAPSPSLRPCGFTAGMAKIPATAWRLGRSLILSLSPGPVPGDGCVARVRGERVSSLESPHPLASCLVRSVRLYRLHKETADAWVSGSRLPDEVQYNRFFPFLLPF